MCFMLFPLFLNYHIRTWGKNLFRVQLNATLFERRLLNCRMCKVSYVSPNKE
jgi:hypothetical protein